MELPKRVARLLSELEALTGWKSSTVEVGDKKPKIVGVVIGDEQFYELMGNTDEET